MRKENNVLAGDIEILTWTTAYTLRRAISMKSPTATRLL